MQRVKHALLALLVGVAAASGVALAHTAPAPGLNCAAPKDRADVAICAQLQSADAAAANLLWSRWEIALLIAALAFCAWAARSAAKAAEAAKTEQSAGDRPFAFLIVHALQYEPIVGGGSRPSLEGRLFKLAYVIKNYGRSACIVRRVAITFGQGAAAPGGDKIEIVTHPSWVIPENGEEADQISRQMPWSVEGLEAYRDSRETLFITGEIQYEDLGGAQYVRRFCLTKGFEKPAAEEGGARANYDRRVYSNPRFNVSAQPPPPRAPAKQQPKWPPEELPPPPAGKSGARVIPLKQ